MAPHLDEESRRTRLLLLSTFLRDLGYKRLPRLLYLALEVRVGVPSDVADLEGGIENAQSGGLQDYWDYIARLEALLELF